MSKPFVDAVENLLLDSRHAEALRVARLGFALHPENPSLWEYAASCAAQLGDDAHAAACWSCYLELRPDSAHAHNDLAIVLERLERSAQAEVLYRRALELKPDFVSAHSNLGVLLTDARRDREAEAAFRAALAIEPDHQRARLDLAQLLLMQGRYAEGWPLHEGRLFTDVTPGDRRASACRQWAGEPLAGKAILVVPEQGLGDEIQFCRYVPWLKEQGAAQVTLACWPSQKTLMETLPGADRVIALGDIQPYLGGHDYWTFLMSLPLHAGTELTNVPAPIPYLFADGARATALPVRRAGEARRIGIVWRGNPKHSNDAERSLPSLEILAPLWSVDGARFYSLQKSKAPLPAPPPGLALTDLAPAIDDWADTAALLSQLDLLIAVDTSTAHLAGALGLPCWILLPWFKTDWRWLRERSDSPWYPKTRLFRQPRRGDWESPVADMAAALRDFIAAPLGGADLIENRHSGERRNPERARHWAPCSAFPSVTFAGVAN